MVCLPIQRRGRLHKRQLEEASEGGNETESKKKKPDDEPPELAAYSETDYYTENGQYPLRNW